MQDISEEMVEAIFAEVSDPLAILLTLDGADFVTAIRASSDPDDTVSRGETYHYFPFSFAWGGASADEATRGAKLEIGNTDGVIMSQIRALPAGAQVSLNAEVVRISAPDDVEMALTGARVADVEVDDPKVIASISPRSFETEPACAPRYTASRTPGIMTR